ncbi:MAG: hypothetical protein JEZ09_19020 [Salinivirgaceae bacterium]|nr:hypothetical protein [Salinivirgaceae bacterium]
MTKKIFTAVSFVFHPVFMPLVGIFIILSLSHLAMLPFEGKKAILLIVAITTLFFPLAVLPVLYYQKLITKITVTERKERLLPMFLTILFYYFGYYILHKYSAPVYLQHFLLATILSISLASIIHLKWKISTHMIGIGGILGLLSSMGFLFQTHFSNLMMLVILSAGLIGTSRLYLKEHNHLQIYSGFILGYLVTFLTIVLMNI